MKKVKPEETKPQASQETQDELSQQQDILTDEEVEKVSGGVRDVATGQATGKRQHKPIFIHL